MILVSSKRVFDSCIVGIEHLDRVEHLYGAYQNVNIDISCRINSPE